MSNTPANVDVGPSPFMVDGEQEIILYRGSTGLGFNIRGGEDSPYLVEDNGIFVVKIRSNGGAAKDGRLKEGDKILAINGVRLEGMKHVEAVNQFLDAGDEVKLVILAEAERKILESRAASNLDARGYGILGKLMVASSVLAGITGAAALVFVLHKHYRLRSSR